MWEMCTPYEARLITLDRTMNMLRQILGFGHSHDFILHQIVVTRKLAGISSPIILLVRRGT